MRLALIVAATEELGIGLEGSMPWRLPKDMAYFKKVTSTIPKETIDKKNVVIMGRVTWESIPQKFRPMSDRFNIIISRNASYDLQLSEKEESEAVLANSFEEALLKVDEIKHARVFVMGGSQIYQLAINHTDCKEILLTRIKSNIKCDAFFPVIDKEKFRLASHQELEDYVQDTVQEGNLTTKDLHYEFTLYKKIK